MSGQTRLAALIGDPARHSVSPAIHNAAFAARDLDWVFLAFEVAAGEAGVALDAMRSLGIDGLSVTMPHKSDVARLVDELTPEARRLDAVNCVVRDGRTLTGHNTDGVGFVTSLAADAGFDPAGRRCVVLGAGGAARAVIVALADAGAAEVVVLNRTSERAERAAELAGGIGRGADLAAASSVVASADLVVHATSVGMDGTSNPLAEAALDALGAATLVADLIYHPAETPLLAAARARGLVTLGGLGMLVHQAAAAFTLWTGAAAPVETMVRAARAAMEPSR